MFTKIQHFISGFILTAIIDLFKLGFWLPWNFFGFLPTSLFSTFTKLFSKDKKLTLLWRNIDNSSDLKLFNRKFLWIWYIKILDSYLSNILFIILKIRSWSLKSVLVEEVCLKEYLLFVNISSIEDPLPLKQVLRSI